MPFWYLVVHLPIAAAAAFSDLVKLVGRDQGGFSIAPAFGCVTPQDFFRIRRSAPFALETWQPPNSAYRFKLVSHKGSRTLSFFGGTDEKVSAGLCRWEYY